MPVSVLLMCVYISHVTVLFTSVFLIILKYTNVHIQCALAQGLTGCIVTQACLYLDPPTTITVLTLEGKLRVLAAVHGYHNSPGHFVPRLAGDVSHTTAHRELVYSFSLFALFTDRLGRPEFSCRQRVTRTCSTAVQRLVRIIVRTNSTQVTDWVRYLTVVHCIHRGQVHHSLFYSQQLFLSVQKVHVFVRDCQSADHSHLCLPSNSDQGCFRQ